MWTCGEVLQEQRQGRTDWVLIGLGWVGLGCKYLTGLGRVGLDCFQTGSGLDRVGASNISSLDF